LGPVLVKVGDFQLGAVLDGAGSGLKPLEEELEESGLARAVEADHADLIPTPDGGGEILDDGSFFPGIRDLVDRDYLAAGELASRGV